MYNLCTVAKIYMTISQTVSPYIELSIAFKFTNVNILTALLFLPFVINPYVWKEC
jgi:hypothetical protein